MISSHLDFTEDDALKRILRHHDVPVTHKLVEDLSQLVNWVHESEQAKASFTHDKEPPPMISLLGAMGIHGKEYINKVVMDG